MRIFPPVQFLSHVSCFMARKSTRGHKCIPTCIGTSWGGRGGDHLAHLPSMIAYCLILENTNTSLTLF